MTEKQKASQWSYQPLTPDRWADFEELFGPQGGHGGCWCMWFKLTNAEFERTQGEGNRSLLKAEVDSGVVPGLMAYQGGRPVGWCAVEPRENLPRLDRSRIAKKIDDQPVWSLVCFYVKKEYRGQGLTEGLIEAALEHVRREGGRLVEAYPVDASRTKVSNASAYHGLAAVFKRLGFEECARRSDARPMMRKEIR